MDLLNYYSLTNLVVCAFCRMKRKNRTKKNSVERLEIICMEDAQRTHNYEDEVKVFGMGTGNAGIESNGNGEGRE
jgi:hypothetical protein